MALQVSIALWIFHRSAINVQPVVLLLVEYVNVPEPQVELSVIFGRITDIDFFPIDPLETNRCDFNLLSLYVPRLVLGLLKAD